MKAKLIINDVEIEVEVSKEELQRLKKLSKKTGYERAPKGETYYLITSNGITFSSNDVNADTDDTHYKTANYYSSKTVAKNNARADELMRKLRRFAVEHREKDIDWSDGQVKYGINYMHNSRELTVSSYFYARGLEVYFDSKETAQYAIDFFYKDLIWYFTEYKDSCSEDDSNEN